MPAASGVAWLVPLRTRYGLLGSVTSHAERIASPGATKSTGSPAGTRTGEKAETLRFRSTEPIAMMALQLAGASTGPVPLAPSFPPEPITKQGKFVSKDG